jgi:transcriptional regulator of acetoin/glycerol metabolism
LSSASLLTIDDIASIIYRAPEPHALESYDSVPLDEIKRRAVMNALRETKGDKLAAARLLGIGKTTFYRKLKKYGIALKATEAPFHS